MADRIIDDVILTDIANAIRENTGETGLIIPEDMPNKVSDCYAAGFAEAKAEGHAVEDAIIERTISGSYTNDRVSSIGYDAFRYCSDITEAHFPKVKFTGFRSFANCTRLKVADFPLLTSADDQLFASCIRLTTVSLPLLKGLPYRCFYADAALAEVELPSVTNIGTYAFQGCSALVKVVLSATSVCSLSSANAFTNTPVASGTGFVYVPDELVEAYKMATNWSTYADQIRSITEMNESVSASEVE